ncbi:ATP-binding protein [Streptomyces sp. NPDC088789]|uniref:ATP-binding protein n=1 Tax=Streptomyces sp. NPDC088789 TaxID=3365899 RepID=UPI00380CF97E
MNHETSHVPAAAPRVQPEQLHEFAMRFTSSARGARLARRLVGHRLDAWGHPYLGHVNETLTLITSELTGNAVRHGHVPGRDFHLRLTERGGSTHVLRVEVTDPRTERLPRLAPQEPAVDKESGWGLVLVARLASRWAVEPRAEGPGKTVWAELRVPQDIPVPPAAGA